MPSRHRSSMAADAVLCGIALVKALSAGVESHSVHHRPLARNAKEALQREREYQRRMLQRKVTPLLVPTPRPINTVNTIDADDRQHGSDKKLETSRVPSSRFARLWEYGTLAAGLGVGVAGEALQRLTTSASPAGDRGGLLLNEGNVTRLVKTLSRMRGAALKVGQMLSIQDAIQKPARSADAASSSPSSPDPLSHLAEALTRLQSQANAMPKRQLEQVMRQELGSNWRSKFVAFEEEPFAAASIGQVHRAKVKLVESDLRQYQWKRMSENSVVDVAVKVQYPGVGTSIESDLDNLMLLAKMSGLLPKGLYLENTIRVAKMELSREIDYLGEAERMMRFRTCVADMPVFVVPRVVGSVSTERVLTGEYLRGVTLGKVAELDQHTRNTVAERLLHLCLRELFVFRFMQTDPNWANFLYDYDRDQISLLDFGAAREFDRSFTDTYMRILMSAMDHDVQGCIHWSRKLGFLTGSETEAMEKAHVTALMALAAPFQHPGIFDFSAQTTSQEVRDQIPVMLRHRLTPPPEESYSLHRKLSGAFLLCSKLGAKIPCQQIFQEYRNSYRFNNNGIEGN